MCKRMTRPVQAAQECLWPKGGAIRLSRMGGYSLDANGWVALLEISLNVKNEKGGSPLKIILQKDDPPCTSSTKVHVSKRASHPFIVNDGLPGQLLFFT